jgi:dynein heavy chain
MPGTPGCLLMQWLCTMCVLQVADFSREVQELLEKLHSSGPGLPTTQLAQALPLLQQFQQDLAAANATRDQLSLAEKLFGMQGTSYPALSQVGSWTADDADE